MALAVNSFPLLLFVVAGFCTQLYRGHDFPGRCSCHNTIKFIKGNMSDFQVLEKRPGCDKIELIVTMNRPDNATEKICMNTEGRMARAFFRCWERINKDENRKMECIERKRKAESTSCAANLQGSNCNCNISCSRSHMKTEVHTTPRMLRIVF